MAFLYGRAGRFTAENGGFRPGQFEAEFAQNCCAHGICPGTDPLSGVSRHAGKCRDWSI